MPRRTRRRQNRPQAQESEGSPSRASQGQSRSKKPRRPSSRRWFTTAAAQWTGIAVIVVAVIAGLVVYGVRTSSGGDFKFSMYAGGDVIGGWNEVSFSELFPSEKPLVLNFWAGLCPPCRAEMPGFQAVYDQHQGDFILLGLDIGPFVGLGSNEDARNLLEELGISYPTGYTHNSTPVTQYRVTSMPTTVFFTPDGKLFKRWQGFLDQGRMTRMIEDLLRASVASSYTIDENPSVHHKGPGPTEVIIPLS